MVLSLLSLFARALMAGDLFVPFGGDEQVDPQSDKAGNRDEEFT